METQETAGVVGRRADDASGTRRTRAVRDALLAASYDDTQSATPAAESAAVLLPARSYP